MLKFRKWYLYFGVFEQIYMEFYKSGSL